MTRQRKRVVAKALICLGATVGAIPMWATVTVPAAWGLQWAGWPPTWAEVMMATASALLVAGLLLGSRGLGEPLTASRLFSQFVAFPCWIPVAVYLVGLGAAFLLEAVGGF